MKGLVGFCVLNWSGIDSINDCATGVLVRDELAHSTYIWKLADFCDNAICIHYKRGKSVRI
jgi:hypothetical protein